MHVPQCCSLSDIDQCPETLIIYMTITRSTLIILLACCNMAWLPCARVECVVAEVRQGAEAGPSNAGPSSGVEARFGPPNQASTAAIQTCLQTGLHSVSPN